MGLHPTLSTTTGVDENNVDTLLSDRGHAEWEQQISWDIIFQANLTLKNESFL